MQVCSFSVLGGGLMKDEQKIVVAWMHRHLLRTGWTAEIWARKAGISPTSVTRALRSENSVTTLPVLHKLAQAADVDSVLDFLERS